MQQGGTKQYPQPGGRGLSSEEVRAAIARGLRFPSEDGGKSLAEMAQSDLDAALQLLADRAQYITGANGAAIALRRRGRNDMLCRASTGSGVPELGSLLSTEFGLSGESVRTRRPLRCDDAERDSRVNREVCRAMGIASVVVMPVANDEEVLGVFELFSSKRNAFGDRDLTALHRLSQMVETAVRLAQASENLTQKLKASVPAVTGNANLSKTPETAVSAPPPQKMAKPVPPAPPVVAANAQPVLPRKEEIPVPRKEEIAPRKEAAPQSAPPAKAEKPLFWTAASHGVADEQAEGEDQSHVPPMLRSLRKCQACGFPISSERMLCVECEEKKWRGQVKGTQPTKRQPAAKPSEVTPSAIPVPKAVATSGGAAAAPAPALEVKPQAGTAASMQTPVATPEGTPQSVQEVATPVSKTDVATAPNSAPEFVLSAGLPPSQSWLANNKYKIAAVLVLGGIGAAIFFLR